MTQNVSDSNIEGNEGNRFYFHLDDFPIKKKKSPKILILLVLSILIFMILVFTWLISPSNIHDESYYLPENNLEYLNVRISSLDKDLHTQIDDLSKLSLNITYNSANILEIKKELKKITHLGEINDKDFATLNQKIENLSLTIGRQRKIIF